MGKQVSVEHNGRNEQSPGESPGDGPTARRDWTDGAFRLLKAGVICFFLGNYIEF